MARIYREILIEQMVLTVEEAMSRVIDWWGDLPPSMKDAIDKFRAKVGAAIDSVEFVKKALDTPPPDTDCEDDLVAGVEVDARNFDEEIDFESSGRPRRQGSNVFSGSEPALVVRPARTSQIPTGR